MQTAYPVNLGYSILIFIGSSICPGIEKYGGVSWLSCAWDILFPLGNHVESIFFFTRFRDRRGKTIQIGLLVHSIPESWIFMKDMKRMGTFRCKVLNLNCHTTHDIKHYMPNKNSIQVSFATWILYIFRKLMEDFKNFKFRCKILNLTIRNAYRSSLLPS